MPGEEVMVFNDGQAADSNLRMHCECHRLFLAHVGLAIVRLDGARIEARELIGETCHECVSP
jgi:hypothetical protein